VSRSARGSSGSARIGVAGLLAALLGSSGCAYSLVREGQVQPEPFQQVVTRTVRARGIEPQGEVRTRVVTAAELPPILREALAEEWSGAEIGRYQAALTTLGLWPADRDLVETYVAVYSEEIAGLYLPTSRTLYLVDDVESSWLVSVISALSGRDLAREMVLAHELVHFLQHQSFPKLMDADPWWKSQGDAASAVQAALEGDAVHYGIASLEIDPPAAADLREAIAEEGEDRTSGALAEAPAMLRLTVDFPYAYGYGLSLSEERALLVSPPASTEQVIHPGRRFEPFQAIDLAALRAQLPPDCSFDFEDTFGELGISVLLRDLDPTGPAAASDGWNGDRWLAARCGGQPEFLWITTWDSEADATEFAAAYARIAPRVAERAGMSVAPAARQAGRDVVITTPRLAAFGAQPERIARRGEALDLRSLLAHFAPAKPPGEPSLPSSEPSEP
jgi:hypothetical protein